MPRWTSGVASGLTALAVALAASCGDEEVGAPTGSQPATTPSPTTTAPPATVVTAPSDVTDAAPQSTPTDEPYAGVIVASGINMEPRPDAPRWWVVDLDGDAVIDGSPRVVVEVDEDAIGCGGGDTGVLLPYGAWRIDVGTSVTFAVSDTAPGPRPERWLIEGQEEEFASEPAVHADELRVECPEGAADVAAELAAQRAVWEERGPPSYEFAMTWHIFNSSYGDYRIGVEDGVAVSVLKDGATRLDPDTLEGLMPTTVDEVFDELARRVSADGFDATYDPDVGFPARVDVDEMANAEDDELEVRISELVAGTPAPVVEQPPAIGQRLDATVFTHAVDPPDAGGSFWLVVDLAGGFTVEGSSRVVVQVPASELRCGAEERPIDSLDTLFEEGPPTVSFELTAFDGDPWPEGETFAGPTVTGRQLHIPVCPPTTEERLAELAAARDRWAAAGIDDYSMAVLWSPLGQPGERHRITVVDGATTSVATIDEFGDTGDPVTDPAVLAALPANIEAVFEYLAATIPVQDVDVIFDSQYGYPHYAYGDGVEIDIEFRPPEG